MSDAIGAGVILVTAGLIAAIAAAQQTENPAQTPAQETTDMSTAASTRTQWMFEDKVGLSTHYFPSKAEEVEQVTDAFSVEKVAEQASEAGANWFMLTVHHQPWLMMAPNETYDKLLGHGKYTAKRDLPLDLHKALHAKGIRIMLYVNLRMDDKSGCLEVDPKIQESMGGWPPNDKLVDNIATVYREWSLRYGDKVSGWWVDGASPSMAFLASTSLAVPRTW